MKKNILLVFLSVTIAFLACCQLVWAGQVVTDGTKDWARQAVAQEKSLGAAPAGNTVAVLYFRNTSGSKDMDPLGKGMAFMLMTDLAKAKNLQVVERVKLQALVEELGLGTSGLVDTATAPRVGRILQARYLVGGDLLKGQTADLKVDSDVIGVQKNDVLGNPQAEGMLAQLFDVEKQLVFQIVNTLNIKVTPEEREELKQPMSTSTQALLNLFMAIDSSDRKDYLAAEGYYKKALENDPKLMPAMGGLEELKQLKLGSAARKSKAMAKDLQDMTSHTDSLVPDQTDLRGDNPEELDKRESTAGQINVRW